MRQILSRNPYTGQLREQIPFISNQALTGKLNRAQSAFQIQRARTIQQRADIIANLGEQIDKHHKQASQLITFQTGKPILQAQGQVKKAAIFCRYYSTHFNPILPQVVKTDAKKRALVKYLPLGTIYYLVPFNFPFYLCFKGGLPNLLLGNCLLTRNSDSTPLVGRLVEQLMIKAGFDQGQFQNVQTTYDQIDQIFSRQSVCGVSFTGSSKSGAIIAAKAGQYLKRAVMELGGNDPFVVLKDADMKLAIAEAVRGRCANAGQVCFSPKRFIIATQVYEEFKKGLIAGLQEITFGDPMNPTTKMGPLARQDLIDNLQKQLTLLPKSYKIIFQRAGMKKPFFPITVIEGSDQVFDQQLFGPVFQLLKAHDEQHAIRLANSGSYGLGGSVFSTSRGQQVIDRIRCGIGFVNEVPKSDTTFPSGGVARSGFGRECGTEGYRQFANIKAHYVN